MDYLRARLVRELARYFGDDNRRIEHALRVPLYAAGIVQAREEGARFCHYLCNNHEACSAILASSSGCIP